MEISQQDRESLERRGITEDKFAEELRRLKCGFPYLRVQGPATAGNGIMTLTDERRAEYQDLWDKYIASGAKVIKMVPASGAASRMFKNLFKFAAGDSLTPDTDFISEFCDGIHRFAFFAELDSLPPDTTAM